MFHNRTRTHLFYPQAIPNVHVFESFPQLHSIPRVHICNPVPNPVWETMLYGVIIKYGVIIRYVIWLCS